jgi:O-antigen/teichoic acid export membrane protein
MNAFEPGSNLRTFLANSGIVMFGQVFAGIGRMVSSVLIARILGLEGNGLFAIAIWVPEVVFSLLNLGLGPAIVYYGGKPDISIGKLTRYITGLSLLFGGSSAAIISLFLLGTHDKVFPNVPLALLLIASTVGIPIVFFYRYTIALFQAREEFRAFSLSQIGREWILVGGVVLGNLFGLINVASVVWFWVLAAGLATIIGLLISRTIPLKAILMPILSLEFLKGIFGYGLKAHLGNVLTFFHYRIDVFILNLFLDPAMIGLYNVGVDVVETFWVISYSASAVLFPLVSKANWDRSSNRKLSITPIISRHLLLLSLPVVIGMALLGPILLPLVYGKEYLGATQVLLFLLPGAFMLSFSRPLSNDIAGRGHPEINSIRSGFVVIVNIAANLLLIPRLGVIGAAISSTFSYSINGMITAWLYTKISGVPLVDLLFIQKEDFLRGKQILSNLIY